MAQERPRGTTPRPRIGAAAKRSYPMSEVRAVPKMSYPTSEVRVVAGRSYPMPKVRVAAQTSYHTPKVRGGGQKEKPHIQGKRNPSKTVGVMRGHQRADTLKP